MHHNKHKQRQRRDGRVYYLRPIRVWPSSSKDLSVFPKRRLVNRKHVMVGSNWKFLAETQGLRLDGHYMHCFNTKLYPLPAAVIHMSTNYRFVILEIKRSPSKAFYQEVALCLLDDLRYMALPVEEILYWCTRA